MRWGLFWLVRAACLRQVLRLQLAQISFRFGVEGTVCGWDNRLPKGDRSEGIPIEIPILIVFPGFSLIVLH